MLGFRSIQALLFDRRYAQVPGIIEHHAQHAHQEKGKGSMENACYFDELAK